MTTATVIEQEKRQARKGRFRNLIGLLILFAALGWSVVHVAILAFGPESETGLGAGKSVIRFAHWQLEGRCVEALNEACRDYEKHKLEKDGVEVAVRQIEIPERAYEQWTRTQLIGRTAPDLIELRWWQDLVVRYFVPLTEYVEQPNPWNAYFDEPEAYAERPWRETYIDNMMGGWNNDLRDFYGMPMSLFTVRIYANKTLMEQAAGVDEPPKTLGQFMAICRQIEDYAESRGEELIPIAGSKYTENVFRGRYWGMATWGMLDERDENYDGWYDDSERVDDYYTGQLDFAAEPHMRAGYRCLYDISRHFNQGFMASQRDQSVLLFAQGKAAMIATGTWDAGSLWRQIAGDFEIMVFDFPIPAPDERYGEYIRYRLTEAGARAGFSMGLTRFSENKELAIDFMRFLTSRRYNEKLNRAFRWFPAIRGAEPDPILKAFRPEARGIYNVYNPYLKGDTELRWDQQYQSYISAKDPTEDDHAQFLADLAAGGEALEKPEYRFLVEKARSRLDGKAPTAENYPFQNYLLDWRDAHYLRFITTYENDYRKHALDDFHRSHVASYHRVVQAEAAIASGRARGMRQGLEGKVRRTLSAVLLGQTSKVADRVRFQAAYDKLKPIVDRQAGREGAK